MEKPGSLIRLLAVEPLDEFRVRITFKNGVVKEIDLEPLLRGEIFAPIRNDIAMLRSVKVVDSTIDWDNGADIDPDVLYYDLKPVWMDELVAA